MEDDIAQVAPTEYAFTAEEQQLLQGLATQVLQAKEKIHDLNVDLEQAQTQLKALQARYAGALQITAARMRMSNAQVSQDQARLTRR
jgi:hypothetical protein